MLRKKQLLEFIGVKLAHLKACVATLNAVRFFDLNVAAEDFFAKCLNEIFGYSLVNLNHDNLNKAAVDLGDAVQRIAFQVTSERTKHKIQKTIDKFEAKGLSRDFDTLKALIIGDRTGDYPTITVPSGVTFSGSSDVLDIADLMKVIDQLAVQKLEGIADLIDQEIHDHPSVLAVQQQTDSDALDEYRAYFDRPAFQDDWQIEGSYKAFESALTGLIELLNKGTVNGQPVAKKRSHFQDSTLRDGLDIVHKKLMDLRALFTTHVRSGEINLDHNCCQFHDPRMIGAFNTFKGSVISELNIVLTRAGKAPAPGVRPIPKVP